MALNAGLVKIHGAKCPTSDNDPSQLSNVHGFFGGAYDNFGTYIENSRSFRSAGIPVVYPHRPESIPNSYKNIAGKTLYGGPLYGHFGHFLLESTSRLWPIISQEYDQIYFQTGGNRNFGMQDFQVNFFERCGISSKLLIDDIDFCFQEIDIPDPALIIDRDVDEKFSWIFDKIRNTSEIQEIEKSQKIYLSRTDLDTGIIAGEVYLEAAFVEAGYRSICMEKLSSSQQIELFSQATHVAGIQGSAFHNLLFSSDGVKSFVFVREDTTLPTFEAIDKIRKVQANYYRDILKDTLSYPPFHAQGPFLLDVDKLNDIQSDEQEIVNLKKSLKHFDADAVVAYFHSEWNYCRSLNSSSDTAETMRLNLISRELRNKLKAIID